MHSKFGSVALVLTLMSTSLMATPAMATFVTDSIINPSAQWNGIDYWGIQVSQFTTVDQILTFNIANDSKIDLFMGGSPKFQFTDVLLNGQSIASNFTLTGSNALMGTGYAPAGTVSLLFQADYTCRDCWSDWFGGYVQVTQATLPTPPITGVVPEPATWAMMLAGMGVVGAIMRRHRAKVRLV